MHRGKLEVLLVGAKDLKGSDFISKIDPYAVITCRTQEYKSSVSSGSGSTPEWNENFVFTISGSVPHLGIKLYDKDTFTADDYLGEAQIPLGPVFEEGSLPITPYNVVKDGKFCGLIKLSLTFKPENQRSRAQEYSNEELGGWKHSSLD